MQFGRVEPLELANIDFALPLDTESTINTLRIQQTGVELNIYVGAPKWMEKTWIGKLYPKQLPENQFLHIYSQNFNTVEFSPSFYNIYTPDELKRWTSQVIDTPDFKFCPKFPQMITHMRRLANAEKETTQFYQSLTAFGSQLGPLMLQLGENFSPKSFPQLRSYLESLPSSIKVNVEFRHKDWFADAYYRRDMLQLLKGLNIGTVITDAAGRRDCVHMELTTSDAIIRFIGNNLDVTDYKRLNEWVDRLKVWADQGLSNIYFFMHQIDERYVPEACVYLINKLNAKLGTSIKAPKMIER